MIEIIPNWHPIFVHFTVAMLSLAVGFHLIYPLFSDGKIKQQIHILAHWNLWLGTGFGIITAIAGWFAYNSVAHDAPSHAAMTEHRNWALVTISLFIFIVAWSLWSDIKNRQSGKIFLIGLFIAGILLFSTAWHGAESVYRYGLGVMSLPQPEGDGHSHEHGEAIEEAQSEVLQSMENHIDSNIDIPNEHEDSHDQSAIEIENIEPELKVESETGKRIQESVMQSMDDHSGHQH